MIDAMLQRKYDYIENEAEKKNLAMQARVDFLELDEEIE